MLNGTQTQDDRGLDAWREQVERAWRTCEGSIEASLREEWLSHMWTIWGPYSFTVLRM